MSKRLIKKKTKMASFSVFVLIMLRKQALKMSEDAFYTALIVNFIRS